MIGGMRRKRHNKRVQEPDATSNCQSERNNVQKVHIAAVAHSDGKIGGKRDDAGDREVNGASTSRDHEHLTHCDDGKEGRGNACRDKAFKIQIVGEKAKQQPHRHGPESGPDPGDIPDRLERGSHAFTFRSSLEANIPIRIRPCTAVT